MQNFSYMLLNIPFYRCGRSSGVERNLAKVDVEGSNPFTRSNNKSHLYGGFFVIELRVDDENPRKRGFDYKRKADGSTPVGSADERS